MSIAEKVFKVRGQGRDETSLPTLAEACSSMVWHRGLRVFMSNNVFINLCNVNVYVVPYLRMSVGLGANPSLLAVSEAGD